MPQFSEQELQEKLRAGESESVEFCQSPDSKDKIKKAICAFANDLPNSQSPGLIFIGVKDDGGGAGLSVTDEMLRKISDLGSDIHLTPWPIMSVRKIRLNPGEMIAIEIQPAQNPPMRFNGRCYIRRGPSVQQASQEEEERLAEKRQSLHLPFDTRGVEGASLSDLNLEYFQSKYWPSAVSSETRKANNRELESKLQSLKLLDRKRRPTAAALLIMGEQPCRWLPGAYIQFIRFEGRAPDPDTVKIQEEISGTLPEQIRQIENILKANIAKSIVLTETTHIQPADYPLGALSQITRNALMHRSYRSPTPSFIRWFSDRIEITSPGGPFGEANQENFGQEGVVSHRNPTIAEALKILGFVEKSGFGIFQARKLLKENGNPDLKFEANSSIIAHIGSAERPSH